MSLRDFLKETRDFTTAFKELREAVSEKRKDDGKISPDEAIELIPPFLEFVTEFAEMVGMGKETAIQVGALMRLRLDALRDRRAKGLGHAE